MKEGQLQLQFSQTTASQSFSTSGTLAGQTIKSVGNQLIAGTLKPADVPVQIVNLGQGPLIVNTRSALALSYAGIPQSQWQIVDMTGNPQVMNNIAGRLSSNGLGKV